MIRADRHDTLGVVVTLTSDRHDPVQIITSDEDARVLLDDLTRALGGDLLDVATVEPEPESVRDLQVLHLVERVRALEKEVEAWKAREDLRERVREALTNPPDMEAVPLTNCWSCQRSNERTTECEIRSIAVWDWVEATHEAGIVCPVDVTGCPGWTPRVPR